MKFVLLCDIVRAPSSGNPIVGMRLSGAALSPSDGEKEADVLLSAKALFARVANIDLPAPDHSDFSKYLNSLDGGAGPLFPWIGGNVQFVPLWASVDPNAPAGPVTPSAISSAGIAMQAIVLPNGGVGGQPNFEMKDTVLAALRHAALQDLIGTDRTNKFAFLEPFVLSGLYGNNETRRIDEISGKDRSFRYEAFMAGLASVAAPVPHGRLNLARFGELTKIDPPPTGDHALMVAAPSLKLRNSAIILEPDLSASAPIVWTKTALHVVATIPYNANFHNYPIEVVCRAIDLTAPATSASSFIDLNTYWVRRNHTRQADDPRTGVGFDDWLSQLAGRASEGFDLPRLLLNALYDDVKKPGAPLSAAISAGDRKMGARCLTHTLLAALRDIVGPGCIVEPNKKPVEGPNGSPAHRTIVELVRQAAAGTALDETKANDLLTAIEADDKAFRDAFRRGGTNADARLLEWFDILAAVIGPRVGLARTGAAFAEAIADAIAGEDVTAGAYDPTCLGRVLDAAVEPMSAAEIQIGLWRRAVGADRHFDAWFFAATDAFKRLFAESFDLVGTLRKANLDLPWIENGGIWRKMKPGPTRDIDVLRGTETEKGSIRETISAYVLGTACEAIGAATDLEQAFASRHGRMGALPASARSTVVEAIDGVIGGSVRSWFDEPREDGDGDTLLTGPLVSDAHPVALQVDRMVLSEAAGPDFNEDLAGYGILMRRTDSQENWRCLTASFAEIDPETTLSGKTTPVEFVDAPRTMVGTLPVGYVGLAPQASLFYDNRPIVGDGQADASTDPQDGPPADPRILRLLQPVQQHNPPEETLLPFLAYGATFEIAPFGATNHGALPEEIRRSDYPALLDPDKLAPDLFPPDSEYLRRFTYLRRTGIGALNVAADPLPDATAYHPMVPGKETRPIVEEILVPPQAVEPWLPIQASEKRRPLKMKTALLLTAPDSGHLDDRCSRLTLSIAPPVTSLEDFDRWIAFEEPLLSEPNRGKLRTFRKAIRDRYNAQTLELNDHEARLSRASGAAAKTLQRQIEAINTSLLLQDPAVDALAISVRRVRRNGALPDDAAKPFAPAFIPWGWQWNPGRDPDDPFADRGPIQLFCKIDPSANEPFDPSRRTVALAAGDVVVVQLFAAVRKERFSDAVPPLGIRRFDRSVREASVGNLDDKDLPSDGTDTYRLFSLHEIAIEAASQALPLAQELAAAISGQIVGHMPAAADERAGDVRLDFTRTANVAMDAVGSVTVGTQAWHWTGRPLPPFPFKAPRCFNAFPHDDPSDPYDANPTKRAPPPSASEYPFLWDIAGFAERLDETLGDPTVAVPIAESVDASGKASPAPRRIARNSPQRMEVARYLRFRASVRSRYEAAYAAIGTQLAPRSANWESSSGLWTTPWYRILRPAAAPADVPKPSIKAILPLTRALKEGDEALPVSGVLAVMDGAWYEHAGLADWMLAGVEVAHRAKLLNPATSAPGAARAVEIGPDPLVRTYGLSNQSPLEKRSPTTVDELRTVAPVKISGPLGHGFDTGTATGLFLNSSFVVRPPDFAMEDPDAWWMGKLAFRRIVLAEGVTGYWAGSSASPASSTSGQLSITQHAIAAPPKASTASISIEAQLATTAGETAHRSLEVDVQWDGHTCTLVIDGATSEAVTLKNTAFDLRILAVRHTSLIDPAGSLRFAWFDILLLVRERDGHWFVAWQSRWFDAPADPMEDTSEAELTLSLESSPTDSAVGPKQVSRALQVSEPTEGRWTQFLPNMDVLGRLGRAPLDSLSMRIDPEKPTNLLLNAGGGWLSTNGLKAERGPGKENQGLFNLLLVTAGIASVSGDDDEIFIGLYHSPNGYDNSLEAIPLEPFETNAAPSFPSTGALIGRILTVRTGKPQVVKADISDWRDDPWKQFFPHEAKSASDPERVFATPVSNAALQIIEIYAPIYLQDRG